jgi:hypothetical protein
MQEIYLGSSMSLSISVRPPLDGVREAIRMFGFSATECIVIPGWFDSTFKEHLPELMRRRIAMLRVDCDWYASVKLTLEQMVPLVATNGTIIIDDYFVWEGCARATHDYLSQNNLPFRIRSSPHGAWMVKHTDGQRPPT